MPYRVALDPAAGLATVTVEPGPSNLLETLEMMRALAADPMFRPGVGVLVDARALTWAPRYAEAEALADANADPRVWGGHPIALLVADVVYQGIANMVGTLTALRGGHARMFTDPAEARAWLEARTAIGQ